MQVGDKVRIERTNRDALYVIEGVLVDWSPADNVGGPVATIREADGRNGVYAIGDSWAPGLNTTIRVVDENDILPELPGFIAAITRNAQNT